MLLATFYSLRYTIVLPRDGLWGAQDENGTWNGIIKDVQDKASCLNSAIRPILLELVWSKESQRRKVSCCPHEWS